MTPAESTALLLPAAYDLVWSLVVLVLVVVPVGLVVWVVVRLVRGPADPRPSQAALAARRHATAVSALAWVALAAAMVLGVDLVSRQPLSLEQGLMLGLVPAVAGLSLAAVQAVGELTWPRPTGTVRRAPLRRRTAADVAPVRLRRAVRGWAAGLGVLLLTCGLVAEPDGRSIGRTYADGLGTGSSGPFPGWYYGIPLLAGTLVVLLAAEGTLRLIARRPAVSETAAEWDLGLRRLSAHRLLRGTQLVLAVTTAGVLLVAGNATRSVGSGTRIDDVPMDSTVHVVVGSGLMLAALVVVVVALAIAATAADTPPHAPVGLDLPRPVGGLGGRGGRTG